jgi:hypothetical protein
LNAPAKARIVESKAFVYCERAKSGDELTAREETTFGLRMPTKERFHHLGCEGLWRRVRYVFDCTQKRQEHVPDRLWVECAIRPIASQPAGDSLAPRGTPRLIVFCLGQIPVLDRRV